MPKYSPAPAVQKIAEELIPKYHQHLVDFSVRLRYLFVDKTPKHNGKDVWGTCRKVAGLTAHLEGGSPDDEPFFAITISQDVWDLLPHDKRVALVDHELCHAFAKLKPAKESDEAEEDFEAQKIVQLQIVPHDVEEFACIVRRYGLWREDVRDFVESALKRTP